MGNKILRSLWFWWILTTAIYILLYILLKIAGYPEGVATPLGHVAGFIGLFVPYGLLSAFLLFSPASLISVIVFLILMTWADRKFNRQNSGLGKRILLNLITLLVLTTLVDTVRLTFFQSWIIFFKGGFPHYCC